MEGPTLNVPARIGKQGDCILHAKKVNERWRVALAGLVAALAIPFLIVDSPAPAEGVVTNAEDTSLELAAPADEPDMASDEVVEPPMNAVEIVVTTTEISPDIGRLADQAGTWGAARSQAIQDGRVAATFTAPPSETNYSLLPVVKIELTPEPEPVEPVEPVADDEGAELDPPTDEPTEEVPEPDPVPGDGEETTPDPDAETAPEPEPEPTPDPEPGPDPEDETPPVVGQPAAPAQIDGRVPPPVGGPTAAQWNALRKCESTHNYAAISPSGLYRGAYQFSQQTWDWVAGIHWPHLVAVDPIDAAPAWQDVMAYTLYAMRGWDQWPICGKNLL